jgi:Carboxypeptidase regulatory-like domain
MTPRLAPIVLVALALGAGQQAIPPLPPTPPTTTPPRTIPVRPQPPSPSVPGPADYRVGVISGQIVDATTGRTMSRVAVRLRGRGVARTLLSDERGRFSFADVPPGDFTISATKSGFFDGAYGKRRAGGNGMAFSLLPGISAPNLKIELFKAGAVSGFVFDEGGEPIIGIRVVALRRQFVAGEWRFVGSGSEVTDDRGEYRLFDLMPGDYVIGVPSLKVTAPIASIEQVAQTGRSAGDLPTLFGLLRPPSETGATVLNSLVYDNDDRNIMFASAATPPPSDGKREFAYPTQYYPATHALALATAVLVTPGTDHRNVNFDLRPVRTFRIGGRVIGPDGAVTDQLLRLLPDDGDDFGLGTETALTVTAPDGSFTFLRVPAGRYTLEARSGASLMSAVPQIALPAPAPVDARQIPARNQLWGRLLLFVDDTDLDDVIVTMQPGQTIAGRIVFDGSAPRPTANQLDRLSVSVVPADVNAPTMSTRLDTLGQFSIGVRPGDYFVRVDAPPLGWYVRSTMAGGRDVSERPLDLSGATVPEVVITFTDRGIEILGTVRDTRGQPAAGATVIVMPGTITERGINPSRMREVRAASSGVYFIEGLPPGEYYIVAVDDADAEGWQDASRLSALRNAATRITLRENEKRTLELYQATRR